MKMRIAIGLLVVAAVTANTWGAEPANPFFAFDNGVGRGQWTPDQQASVLKKLGYAGIGYSGVSDLPVRLEAFKKHQLRVFSLYVACHVDTEEPYAQELVTAIEKLKGTDVVLWLTVQGKADNDERAVEVVRELATLTAASNLKIVLYPHHGFFVATIDDAMRVVKQVDRDNVGVSFNLCHELKAGNEPRFDALLKEAMPHLFLVSINGADHEGNWDTLIQPLDRGEFDVYALLKKLKTFGYAGPIELQCYNVPGDTRENLARSMTQWGAFQKELDEERKAQPSGTE
ncbi:MAG: TIM barrel protein [bacterium]|nr:TIM barrel protein [bacterium]